MILSHKHKFIFLKTAKTGGTSTEIALSRFCGADDVLTPLSPSQERMRRKHKAQNYALGLGRRGIYVPGEIAHRFPAISGFYNHMPGCQVRALVGEKVWNSYFKFTIERNPWDRQVSHYFWRTRGRKSMPEFELFLASWSERLFHKARQDNWSIYTLDDRIAVDRVIQYETLEEELAEVVAGLGIEKPPKLPQANPGKGQAPRPNYREFYNDRTREIVARWYAKEIAAFGYRF